MRDIHVFREPRMGGSLFMGYLVSALNVPDSDINNHEHDLTGIQRLSTETNPFVIRCDRKNLTEHFLSKLGCDTVKWKFTNIFYSNPTNEVFDDLCSRRITIDKRRVVSYIKDKIDNEIMYGQAVKKFDNQTIYYEDMFTPFDIPSLGLYNIDLSNETRYTMKLPDYKREVFTNYDQVAEWIDEIKDDYIKKHNLTKLLEHWPGNSGR